MFEITKIFRFEAGHQLVHHDGKCRDPHGHSYVLEVKLRSNELITSGSKTNMLIDFGDISAIVKPLIEKHLDHKWLNDTLETDSPTAEAIAQWIFEKLKPQIKELFSITIHETASASATFFAP